MLFTVDFGLRQVEIVVARVDGDIEDPAYICTVHATSGARACWPICRRLSRFAALREQLLADPPEPAGGGDDLGSVHFPRPPVSAPHPPDADAALHAAAPTHYPVPTRACVRR